MYNDKIVLNGGETAVYQELDRHTRAPSPRDPAKLWDWPAVAAVGPAGELVIRHLTPGRTGEIGNVPIRTMDGHALLHPQYRAAGWVLYSELCEGKVSGVEPDRDAWTRWENLCESLRRGVSIPTSYLARLLHPEVLRRRETQGVHTPSIEELREMFPGVEFSDDDGNEDAEPTIGFEATSPEPTTSEPRRKKGKR